MPKIIRALLILLLMAGCSGWPPLLTLPAELKTQAHYAAHWEFEKTHSYYYDPQEETTLEDMKKLDWQILNYFSLPGPEHILKVGFAYAGEDPSGIIGVIVLDVHEKTDEKMDFKTIKAAVNADGEWVPINVTIDGSSVPDKFVGYKQGDMVYLLPMSTSLNPMIMIDEPEDRGCTLLKPSDREGLLILVFFYCEN